MDSQQELLNKIRSLQEQLTQTQAEQWHLYSGFNSWQFWLMLALFVIPLVILYLYIDRRNLFLICFYGWNIHVWFTYVDQIAVRYGYWSYPYRLIPYIAYSFVIDSSLIPVTLMLVYQWTMKHNKNFYIYSIGAAFALAFIIKPLMVQLNMLDIHKGMNYFYFFIVNTVILLFSKFMVNIFLSIHKKANKV